MSKKKPMISERNALRIALAIALGITLHNYLSSPSEHTLRGKVVKLSSPRGSCSGEQIRAPSGVDYILTAAHCRVLEVDGQIHVKTEDGRELERRVISEDPNADLMLLEGVPGLQGLDIAKSDSVADNIRTFTHGKGLSTYRTEGVIIEDRMLDIEVSMISSPEDAAKCASMPKYIAQEDACIMHTMGTMVTAMVVPGSSGGMAVNESGELIGVVSAGNDHFGILVPLSEIQAFIHSY